MTYLKQRDRFRCGPIAIFNALRWAGKAVSYKKDIKRLSKLCKCEPPKGTTFRPFISTLRKEGKHLFTVKQLTNPTIRDFDRGLRNDSVLLWNFKPEPAGRHYVLVVGRNSTDKTFTIANWCCDRTPVVTMPRCIVKYYVEQRDRLQRAWVLTKVEG